MCVCVLINEGKWWKQKLVSDELMKNVITKISCVSGTQIKLKSEWFENERFEEAKNVSLSREICVYKN